VRACVRACVRVQTSRRCGGAGSGGDGGATTIWWHGDHDTAACTGPTCTGPGMATTVVRRPCGGTTARHLVVSRGAIMRHDHVF
jgi:hypothetical protein